MQALKKGCTVLCSPKKKYSDISDTLKRDYIKVLEYTIINRNKKVTQLNE